jgi:hypothetical protein
MKQVKSKSFKSDQTQQLNQTQAERWFTQMIKCLPPKCKPDIGHRLYREGITNPVITAILIMKILASNPCC